MFSDAVRSVFIVNNNYYWMRSSMIARIIKACVMAEAEVCVMAEADNTN